MHRSEVLRVAWTAIMRGVNMTGKNQQQIMQAVVAKVKAYHKLLAAFATSAKLELSLLLVVQVCEEHMTDPDHWIQCTDTSSTCMIAYTET